MIRPLFEAREPYWIAKKFLKYMGLKDCFPCGSIEDVIDTMREPLGISMSDLSIKGVVAFPGKPYADNIDDFKFNTPTGKVELYSTRLASVDISPIPIYEPVEDPPKGYFRLLYGRSPVHTFTRTINNEWLNEIVPENRLWLNNEAASKMGIKDGDEVYVVNQDGVREGPVKVFVTPGIRDDCVFLAHGFGQKNPMLRRAYNKGVSDNFLISRIKPDPITGTSGMRVNFVKIEKNGRLLEYTPAGYEERIKRAKAAYSVPKVKIEKKPVKVKIQTTPQEGEEEEGC